jgi:hypothetical protein
MVPRGKRELKGETRPKKRNQRRILGGLYFFTFYTFKVVFRRILMAYVSILMDFYP